MVHTVFGHLFRRRLPRVWGCPTGCTVFLLAVVLQLNDLTLLGGLRLRIAKEGVIKVLIINLVGCMQFWTQRRLVLWKRSSRHAATTDNGVVNCRSYRRCPHGAQCPGR
jgi:hypothetical protein